MKVFVKTKQMGTISYDPNNSAVAVVLTPDDKQAIARMGSDDVYCEYPHEMTDNEIQDWLNSLKKS